MLAAAADQPRPCGRHEPGSRAMNVLSGCRVVAASGLMAAE
jgi:hypothetical protein